MNWLRRIVREAVSAIVAEALAKILERLDQIEDRLRDLQR